MLGVRKFLGLVRRQGARALAIDPEPYLTACKGVIHVGASTGQERFKYANCNLAVLWIEPLPDQFDALQANIRHLPNQRAIQALIADEDNVPKTFHVSNNNGESSSMLDLHMHKGLWPEVNYVRSIQLTANRLPTVLAQHGIDPSQYDGMVLDTQGSELLILRGAAQIIKQFKYLEIEAPDFESYKGCPTVKDIAAFLAPFGFRLIHKNMFSQSAGIGRYYDLFFVK